MRRLALLLTGITILAAINVTVWRYERAMSSGEWCCCASPQSTRAP